MALSARYSAAPGKAVSARRPLIVHVVHRLATGGMENGLVNLINHLPPGRYRHSIVCMTDYTDFERRLTAPGVTVHALGKKEGKDLSIHPRLFSFLRRVRPDIVHTRNLATLECQVTSCAARVPIRLHGEHGWDLGDAQRIRRRGIRIRRFLRPFVTEYVTVSRHFETFLHDKIGVGPHSITQIYNGVNTSLFSPGPHAHTAHGGSCDSAFIIGTVGRLHPVKAHARLLRAFAEILPVMNRTRRAELIIVGSGPLESELRALARSLHLGDSIVFTGERSDIPDLMRRFDVFVLPSAIEGISNTILEAMATGLPVVAFAVGGNIEVVVDGETGRLLEPSYENGLCKVLLEYFRHPELVREHGSRGRTRCTRFFSLDNMVAAYGALYDRLLNARSSKRASA